MVQLFDAKQPVEFDGVVEGERRRLKVVLMSLATESGTVFFEGSVEDS